jgi:hypothetical protein
MIPVLSDVMLAPYDALRIRRDSVVGSLSVTRLEST